MDSVSHAEQWACYCETSDAQGARWCWRYTVVADTAEQAVEKLLDDFEADYPRPHRIEVYPDGTAAVDLTRFERVKRARYRRDDGNTHTAATA